MAATRAATILLAAGLSAAMPGFAAPQGKEKPAPRTSEAPRPPQQNPSRQQPNNPKAQAKNQARGDEIFLNLLKMTPDEREKALKALPPARREQIQKRIENFQNLKPEQQERRLSRVERLNALPLAEQARVRQSTKDLQNLAPDRRKTVNQELQRMSVMGDDEKLYHMNTEEFRNRFSPAEQEMLGNLTKVY
jgi:phage-related protein